MERWSLLLLWSNNNVSMHLPSRVSVTAGTIIGVTEINGQEPLVNITEDVLMATIGVDDVFALVRQFAKPNQELGIKAISFEN